MSVAVICDEYDMIVYDCLKLFDKRFRADGWHLTYKEKGNMK